MLLSAELEAYRKVVLDFVDREVVPFAMTIPAEYGGSGGDHQAYVPMMEEFGRVLTLYEGSSQIQRLIIGRALTGVSAFT